MRVFTDAFGTYVTYVYESTRETFNNLPDRVRKKGFDGFSAEGITSFFTFRYSIDNLTMFKGFKRIPFGYSLEDGKLRKEWYPKFEEKQVDFNDALDRIELLLLKSIERITKDKKIAIPLSGGVDSSMIVALCRKVHPDEEILTYSAGFYGDDEFEYARIVARKFNTVHKEIVLSPEDYIGENSLLRPLIRHKGEPLHPNEIALATVEKMAKEDGCDIAVCGEGGDDIFGGYGQNLRMYMNYEGNKPFFKFFLDNYRYFTIEDRKKLVKDEFLVDDFELLSSFLVDEEMPKDIRNKVFYFIQKIHTPGLITRGINAIKFNKLEPGFPYIDMELVEFVNSLPFDYKLHWKSKEDEEKAKGVYFRDISEKYDIPKYILKKLAERYLPKEIIYRKKYGFPVPFDKWFKDLKMWNLDENIFKTKDISKFNGWKKFMIINLNTFIEEFRDYIK